ncbi:MAG: toxin-antitoxin system HicB family antitoxin [Proteobacteria bacterium]|nr:toxin-antitoxin system HicB family antitoxin [Pseudomonadota bacterium]
MKERDRYLKIVEWSEEDQCYVGTCPGLFLGGCHGDDETKVYKELCQLVDENIALYKADEKPLPSATSKKEYSGKFLLRTGKEFHKVLSIKALQANESLNGFCIKVLKNAVTQTNSSKS